ncbi:MAG: DUF3566 domain-containing protein [Arcanobacterium sp.]|nr:DUF3566 domain-containing protein [Arcanobacterium sp.]
MADVSTPAKPGAEKPAANPAKKSVGVRSVRMTVSRIDPWSALKISFLVSVAIGIMMVIAAIILWLMLDSMHVWSGITDLLTTFNNSTLLQLAQFLEFGRLIPFAIVIAVVEIVLMTALGGLFALVFNVVAMLVGGFKITVTDE